MLPLVRSTTAATKATTATAVQWLAPCITTRTFLPTAVAYRCTHHKAASSSHRRGEVKSTTISSRNASYASDHRLTPGGGAHWDSTVDNPFKMDRPVNVFGRPLAQCGTTPMTGFYRDGYCNTGAADSGSHTVAAVVSQNWLDFSASKGNDLRPFLSEGCSWCLCISRWKQSLDAFRRGELPKEGVPKVKLEATHQKALDVVSFDDLRGFALEGAGTNPQDPARGGPIR